MKLIGTLRVLGLWLLMSALPSIASAQSPEPAPAAKDSFTAAQLEQMVAPIALYPDSLVTQILMAATYPLEIVEAARWVEQNPGLKGASLEDKLKEQEWDVTVKALCGFPDVLKRMNENLDWTRDLGDAFMAQQSDVLDTVQRMRGKAYEAGNLKTNEQQVVTQQPDKIIVIQPTNPQVIYVPTYSPTVVYGVWAYPTYYYPPMYVAPPPGYGMMAFTAGVFWGAALSGNCNWGWGHSNVDIDIHNNFNRNTNINRNDIQNNIGGKTQWKHDPSHRGGVNYRDNKTAQQFGARGGSNRVTRDQARGYDRAGGAGGAAARNNQAGSRPATGRANAPSTRNSSVPNRPSASSTNAAGRSPRSNPSASPSNRSSAGRDSTWSGSRNPGMDRSASGRGSMSRGGGYGGGGGRMGGGGGGGRMGGGRR